MTKGDLHVVTGAFGYSGRYITERLLHAGHPVRTLTNSATRSNPFGSRVEVRPFNFDRPALLADSLRGAAVLYNTYWVRFNHADFNFSLAVENTRALFAAAQAASVPRIVHVSITNPSEDSPFEYFRSKAILERELRDTGLSYAILRPSVLFGGPDILINNIAWLLRRMPVFAVFGDGNYRLQPIHVADFADLAFAQGTGRTNVTIDAIGPETFTYRQLVDSLAGAIGVKRRIVSVPPMLGYLAGWLFGKFLGDVVITRAEIAALMADLLVTESPAVGQIALSSWAVEQAENLGRRYATELGRRRDRTAEYGAS